MKINFKNLLKNIDFGVFVLITSLAFVYSLISLYYDSTQSVDYAKYSNYLKYFLFDQSETNLEQGLIYFYLITAVILVLTAWIDWLVKASMLQLVAEFFLLLVR